MRPDTLAILQQLPAKMVGIAVLVAPSTQFIKRVAPASLKGWKALALNFALTLVASLVAAEDAPDQIRTVAFWFSVAQATLLASGVHGIGKGLGLFEGVFQLPAEFRDPLKWACPHVENDAAGLPCWACPAIPGEGCTNQSGKPVPPHIERLALTEGGGEPVSKGVVEAATEAAGVAPLLSAPAEPPFAFTKAEQDAQFDRAVAQANAELKAEFSVSR